MFHSVQGPYAYHSNTSIPSTAIPTNQILNTIATTTVLESDKNRYKIAHLLFLIREPNTTRSQGSEKQAKIIHMYAKNDIHRLPQAARSQANS